MIVAGLDPGLKGGIAFMDEDDPLMAAPMPKLKSIVDVVELSNMMKSMEPRRVYIERQSILAGQGAALTIGSNYGRLLAVCELLGVPYTLVTPGQWKKRCGFPTGCKGKEKAEAAFELVRRDFGDPVVQKLGLKVTRDGPVEALLIAKYGG